MTVQLDSDCLGSAASSVLQFAALRRKALSGQLLSHILHCKLEMHLPFRHSADMDNIEFSITYE